MGRSSLHDPYFYDHKAYELWSLGDTGNQMSVPEFVGIMIWEVVIPLYVAVDPDLLAAVWLWVGFRSLLYGPRPLRRFPYFPVRYMVVRYRWVDFTEAVVMSGSLGYLRPVILWLRSVTRLIRSMHTRYSVLPNVSTTLPIFTHRHGYSSCWFCISSLEFSEWATMRIVLFFWFSRGLFAIAVSLNL